MTVKVASDPTSLQLFVASGDEAPTEIEGLEPVAQGTSDDGKVTLRPQQATSGRWVVLWLTSVPQDDGFRGRIAEVTVRG